MKNYLVRKINLSKYIFLFIISFLFISIILFFINYLIIKADSNLVLIFNAVIFVFLVLPKIKKISSDELIIKISNKKIIFNELEIDITKINEIKITYEFTVFPKIKIRYNNDNVKCFRVVKLEADYLTFIYTLKNINKTK